MYKFGVIDKGEQALLFLFVSLLSHPFLIPLERMGNQGERHNLVCTEEKAIPAFLYAITTPTTPKYPQTTRNKDIRKCLFSPAHHKMKSSSSQSKSRRADDKTSAPSALTANTPEQETLL